jgi:hypothetical protein
VLLRLTVTALTLAACAHAPCPAGQTCGDARWLDGTGSLDDRSVRARVVALAVPGRAVDLAATDALPVSSRRAFLRFEAGSFAGWTVARAVLTLSPHPAWRPAAGASRLVVRDLRAPWTARSVAEGMPPDAGDGAVTVMLPAGVRGPVRVDVTSLFRDGLAEASERGIALETDRGEAVFMGGAAPELDGRPHLEVVLR